MLQVLGLMHGLSYLSNAAFSFFIDGHLKVKSFLVSRMKN